jgi:hypothetical protein
MSSMGIGPLFAIDGEEGKCLAIGAWRRTGVCRMMVEANCDTAAAVVMTAEQDLLKKGISFSI